MKIENGKNYLITTDSWFYAPNGHQYRAVWGKTQINQAKDGLGFNPTRSANWFIQVGEGETSVIIGGCQVNYAIMLENEPKIIDHEYKEKESGLVVPYNRIYIPMF